MKLLGTLNIKGQPGKRIEFLEGDLTALGAAHAVDLLIVSAFPDDYVPTRTSLIGALHRKGLSVRDLAAAKELDLRDDCSCWLSRKFTPTNEELRFSRILCFEPGYRGDAPAVAGDVFRALTAMLADRKEIKTAAMPILASGDQRFSIRTMIESLLDAALHSMGQGLPLDVLKIVVFPDSHTEAVRLIFQGRASAYIAHCSGGL